jgi:hypothetical protein
MKFEAYRGWICNQCRQIWVLNISPTRKWILHATCICDTQWRFYVGAGGAQAPQMLARPPQIFGQLNFFLDTRNQEIIELSILSHIACYLT